jgi:sugar phosphate isomerase/epimerase
MDGTPRDREERLEKMKLSIHAAAMLGAKYWVVHPLMPFGVQDILTNQEQQTRKINLAFMRELLAVAKQEGVTVCLENMPFLDFSLSSPSDIVGFIEEINDPFFAMCLDTGHANSPDTWTAQDSIAQIPTGRLQALHINDNRGIKDHATDIHFPPFYGTIDWQAVAQALAKYDYPGDFTLEIVGFLEQTPTALLPEALALAHKAGRELIRMVQQLRQEK